MGAAAVFLEPPPKGRLLVPAGCASADPPSFVCDDSNAGVLSPVNSSKEGRMGKLFVGQRRVGSIDPSPVC